MNKIRIHEGKEEIWDSIRKKWVLLTEEEKVRQYCIHRLVEVHQFPISRIAVERQIKLHSTTKRFDIVVFDPSGNPQIVIECKAPHIKLDQEVLEQVGRYNKVLQAGLIGVTNGAESIFFNIDFEQNLIQRSEFQL